MMPVNKTRVEFRIHLQGQQFFVTLMSLGDPHYNSKPLNYYKHNEIDINL